MHVMTCMSASHDMHALILAYTFAHSISGFFSASVVNNPRSTPGLLAQLGYGFFVLIIVASYTANLATILMARSERQAINNIQDAINKGVKICVLEALEPQAKTLFPQAQWHTIGSSNQQVRDLNLGKCGAALIHQQRIVKAHSGKDVSADCAETKRHTQAPEAAELCVLHENDEVAITRDCKFKQVGSVLFTVPLSVPIASRFERAFSYWMRKAQSTGAYDRTLQAYESFAPKTVCPDSSSADSASTQNLRLPMSSMVGVFIISVIIQCSACFMRLVESRISTKTGKKLSSFLHCHAHIEPCASGLNWQNAGAASWTNYLKMHLAGGRCLTNDKLDAYNAELKNKDTGHNKCSHKEAEEEEERIEFTVEKWKSFGVQNVCRNDFIKKGACYFKPVATLEDNVAQDVLDYNTHDVGLHAKIDMLLAHAIKQQKRQSTTSPVTYVETFRNGPLASPIDLA